MKAWLHGFMVLTVAPVIRCCATVKQTLFWPERSTLADDALTKDQGRDSDFATILTLGPILDIIRTVDPSILDREEIAFGRTHQDPSGGKMGNVVFREKFHGNMEPCLPFQLVPRCDGRARGSRKLTYGRRAEGKYRNRYA